MAQREQDELPYRSPVAFSEKTPTTTDEVQFDTLKVVRDAFAESLEGLSSNFNAFNILKNEHTTDDAARDLVRQIEIKQGVYDILMPLFEAVDSAVARVDTKYKER